MAARGKRFPWEDKLLRSGYLLGAVLLHLIVFALLAGYVVFHSPPQEPTLPFARINPNPPDTTVIHPPSNSAAGSASAISIDTGQGVGPKIMTGLLVDPGHISVNVPGTAGVGNGAQLPVVTPVPHVSVKGISPERL